MTEILFDHCFEIAAVILFGIGFMGMFFHTNLIKKIIGFNIMDSSIYLFLASRGYIFGRIAPVLDSAEPNGSLYINPIPTGLVLTGIVVSVSVTAFSLSLVLKLYEKYHTLDLSIISWMAHRERVLIQLEMDKQVISDEAIEKMENDEN